MSTLYNQSPMQLRELRTPTSSSAVPKVVEQKTLGYALIAALAGLAYFTT